MTREAKVGLLLGLVFIVAIAVVLSDVHQNSTDYINETLALSDVEKGAPEKAISEGVNLSVAVKQLSPEERAESMVRVSSPKAGVSMPIVPAEAPAPLAPSMSFPVRSEEAVIRYESFLPSSNRVEPAVVEPAMTEPVPAIVPPSGEVERAVDEVVTQEIPPSIQLAGNLITPPAKESHQIYVVGKGDDLSGIAKKVYGQKEGDRWVNIKKIFEANSKTMGTMDELKIGQKLVIPEIAEGEGISVPVTEIKKAALAKEEGAKGKVYEVKEGDTLWKIAAKQLGNGARYQELAKLNKDMLEKAGGPDKLRMGMKLRLPE